MPTVTNSRFVGGLLSAALLGVVMALAACDRSDRSGEMTADTVQVAMPTGDRETDRARIIAALEEAPSGGTVQFGPGTYLIGSSTLSLINVTVPGLTLLGHPRGTILRGCDPDGFDPDNYELGNCMGLELTGGHQSVRNITFEYFWYALTVGGLGYRCTAPDECAPDGTESLIGGYRVEGNTFRYVIGMGVRGNWSEPAVIRRNTFVNVFHAVSVIGGIAHVMENDIEVVDPEQIPFFGHPGGAISIVAVAELLVPRCDNNVIAGNRIVGHPESINVRLTASNEPESCIENVIRDNTIVNSRIPESPAFPYASGAILLINETQREDLIQGWAIENNRISDSEGVGIALFHASRNRIVGNTISGLGLQEPSSLNERVPQSMANGSGIWLSPGSDHNDISGNTFGGILAHAVVLEGSGNTVAFDNAGDTVHDLGSGNRVTMARTCAVGTSSRDEGGGS
jgi:parallel beta-helix repeat protein